MALVGGLIAAQPAINSTLGRATGSIAAAFISFLIGTVALAGLVVLSRQAGDLGGAFEVKPVYLLGGVLGAIYVLALVVVREVGPGEWPRRRSPAS
jgi:transporter family-2 protein